MQYQPTMLSPTSHNEANNNDDDEHVVYDPPPQRPRQQI